MTPLLAFRKGGVHPADRKQLSSAAAITVLPPPPVLTVPLSQHLGAPCKPVVAKGDEVRMGQVLGEPGGFVSAAVHSPVSGKVKRLEAVPAASGDRVLAVEIENDGKDTWVDGVDPAAADIDFAAAGTFLDRIRQAGVVGMGGAAFPTHVKLSPPRDATVDALVINGAECEPYLTADERLMRERSREVMLGIRAMMEVLKVPRALVGIEDNKPDAFVAMQATAPPGVAVHLLRTRYPQGAEKQLVEALLGRRVPPGKLPFAVGVVVQNVGTAFAVFEAIARGKPLVERVVTVTGRAAGRPSNLLCRVGTPVSALLAAAEVPEDGVRAMISGGPMMGRAFRYTEIPVVKATSGILVLGEDELSLRPEQDCIRCGRCVDACPMALLPCDLAALAEFRRWEDAAAADHCVECGSCQYVCPSRRFLVQWIRLAKAQRRRLKT
ncbi:MAG: electron transport complex subunit RsxC [Deltaproteobacteria bacterium]|nr:electron transport complex subunit RsxC [Deltaproteobacteria bacterium]